MCIRIFCTLFTALRRAQLRGGSLRSSLVIDVGRIPIDISGGGESNPGLPYRKQTHYTVRKTSAFHQEFHQPERKAQDQTVTLTENQPFSVGLDVWSCAWWIFNSVATSYTVFEVKNVFF